MSPSELEAFLERPLTAVVSYMSRDGTPRAVPVWFRHDAGDINIWSDSSRGWVKAVRRDPRATVTLAEHTMPFAAAILRGPVEVEVGRPETILPEARRICARYVRANELDAYVAQYESLDAIVRVRIEEQRAWGRGY